MRPIGELDQTTLSDVRPGRPSWRNGRNISVVVDSGPFAPSYENTTSSTKLEVNNVQATATGNKHRNFGEIWTCGFEFWDMRVDSTDINRHANRNALHPYQRQSNDNFTDTDSMGK